MAKAQIMVVEDEGIVALAIEKKLEVLGYEVSGIIASGEEVIQQAAETPPDLVLMDIMLDGEMDGVEAAGQIRTRFDIPVIYLTANTDESTLQRAKITEPFGYLLKPFEDRELHTTIEMALYKHQIERKLKENEQWLITTLKNIGDAVIATDEQGCITFMNPVAETLTGWPQAEARGQPLPVVFNLVNEETYSPMQNPVTQVFRQGVVNDQTNYNLLISRDGAETPIDYNAAPLKDDEENITGVVLAFCDITERKQAEQRLERYRDHLEELVQERTAELIQTNEQLQREITQRKKAEKQILHDAFHDMLTGLPNRTLFKDHLQRSIGHTRRSKDYLAAVLLLDLDHFKVINDSLGHTIGNELLMTLAHKLKTHSRPGDTVARLGEDEFAILLNGIKDAGEATYIAGQIQKTVSEPIILKAESGDEQETVATASIGIVLSQDARSGNIYDRSEDLLRDADTAIYRAKARGRNRYELFDIGMRAQAMARLELVSGLRRALDRQEFQVYYQPIVSVADSQITGAEALLRWQHPQRGPVSPAEFIPLLEETGLIMSVGEWLLRTTCRQMRAWHTAGYTSLQVAVNVSLRQFQEQNLPTLVQRVLAETELPAKALKLEITESIAMQSVDLSLTTLNELNALGIHLSIDDFGIGYSSLNRLKRLPIQTLKIDQTFMKDIHSDTDDAAIVTAIIAMAHSLNLKVIAEGIETEEQLAFLRSQRCDEAQGYLFSQPLSAEELTALLQKRKPLSS